MKPNELSLKKSPDAKSLNDNEPLIPPLWVWMTICVILLVFVLLSLPYYRHFLKEGDEEMSVNLQRLKSFVDSGVSMKGKRVIVIGTSLIRAGTYSDSRMKSLANEIAHTELRFLRISRLGGTFSDFSPLIEPILAARPDALVIQADLLLDEPPVNNVYATFVRLSLRTFRQRKLGQTILEKSLSQCDDAIKHVPAPLNNAAITAYIHRDANRISPPSPSIKTIELLLKHAAENRIKIIVVTVPRSYLAKNQGNDQKSKMARLMPIFSKHKVERLVFNEPLGLENYTDPAHLNSLGRVRFSRWFVTELARTITGIERK